METVKFDNAKKKLKIQTLHRARFDDDLCHARVRLDLLINPVQVLESLDVGEESILAINIKKGFMHFGPIDISSIVKDFDYTFVEVKKKLLGKPETVDKVNVSNVEAAGEADLSAEVVLRLKEAADDDEG